LISGHVPVHRLLLSVQGLIQHELREAVAVALRLYVQIKVVVSGDGVCAQGISPHVRVEGVLHREAGARCGALGDLHGDVRLRETRRIVVNIHDLDLDAEKLERVLQKHFEVQEARDGLTTYLLSVDALVHHQSSVLQVDLQVRRARARHGLETARGKFGDVQPQIFGDISHNRPALLLLRYREVQLR
uniref:Uncharacterized protein n=1 Tax=Cyprinus carpio TaxID=7962 RepID=A0A8C1QJ06_CYPCA